VWLGLIFEIILVSEERVKIRERLKNKHQALELIQKKLTNK
jgi:hypothetical protein